GISVSEKIGRKVSKLQFEFIVEEDEFSGDEGGSSMELSEEDATFLEEFDKKVPPKKK
ncbi:PI protein, partial [Salmonella enterica]|nr:PI protein [Salmonella enterica]